MLENDNEEEYITINIGGESNQDMNSSIGRRTARRKAQRRENQRKDTRIGNKKEKKTNKKDNGKKEKKKLSKKKVLIIVGIILAILIIVGGISFAKYVYKAEGNVVEAVKNMATDVATNIVGNDEPIFVLVLGISEDITSKLTDTIILAGYNPESQKAFMLSIPRDTFVGTNEANASGWDKINALYQKDIKKTIKAVEERTGVNIDNYVIVRNTMLSSIVGAIGEVEFDVPIDMDYDDPTQDLHIHLKKGVQMIDKDEAEQLLRFRHNNDGSSYPSSWGDNDYGRMRTQREFIKVVAKQLISVKDITKLKGIAEAVFANLETNMSIGDMIGYIPYAINFNVDDIRMEQLPGSGAMLNKLSFYKASYTRSKKLMNELIAYLELDEKETKKMVTGKIKQTVESTPQAEAEDACPHTYGSEIIKTSTCEKEGIRKYTCTLCKSTYEESIATTNHEYGSDDKCIVCGAKKKPEKHECKFTILTHTELPATCIDNGSGIYKCEYKGCGETKSKVIPATGHKYSNGKCTVCGVAGSNNNSSGNTNTTVPGGQEKPEEKPPVQTHSHSYTETALTPATCTTAGSKTETCSDATCGDVRTIEIKPLGHNFVNTNATCTRCTEPNKDYVPPVEVPPVTQPTTPPVSSEVQDFQNPAA